MASEQKLIDANKLYEEATRAWGHTLCDGCYSEIIDLIDEAPTVDAVPVAQGRVTDIKAKMSEILRHGDCPFIFRESESEQLADYLIANSVTVETQTKQSLVYGDYIRCSEDQVPEAKELLLEQMIATIRELAKKDDFFEVSDLEDAETAERIKVSWKFSIPHMKD